MEVINSSEIIGLMRHAAPARQQHLDDASKTTLRDLTGALLATKPQAAEEYARFLAIKQRSLCLPETELTDRLRGATVLVTGGTGCIGSALMAQLAAREPGRLVSVSRGTTVAWPRQEGAEYLYADVRDHRRMERLTTEIRPDVIFHVAAQRSPALAEVEVHRTVSTNVLGARNVLAAAGEAGVPQVVFASTGKALRPYSPEIYTASKRAAEWIASSAATEGRVLCSAGRFTHVVDNSIVHGRLLGWADDEQAVIRLHSAGIAFYVQSALESAQLLLLAFLGAQRGEFRMFAIRDLGWPVSLLDVALGVLTHKGSRTPIYISGYDPGYEEVPFPGLYDPATAGDVSPLMNSFETAAATASPCPRIDGFRLEMAPDPAAPKLLTVLEGVCERTQHQGTVRHALDELSWSLLDATLAAADPGALARAASLTTRHARALSAVHCRVMEAILDHAQSAGPPPSPVRLGSGPPFTLPISCGGQGWIRRPPKRRRTASTPVFSRARRASGWHTLPAEAHIATAGERTPLAGAMLRVSAETFSSDFPLSAKCGYWSRHEVLRDEDVVANKPVSTNCPPPLRPGPASSCLVTAIDCTKL